jgi:hypothetical protein
MPKLRALLVLLALLMAGLVIAVVRFDARGSAETLAEEARVLLSEELPDYDAALRLLERGIRRAEDRDDRTVAAELALEHARVFRHRWDRSVVDREVLSDRNDLVSVVQECRVWLETYEPSDVTVRLLGARAALDLERPRAALPFLAGLQSADGDGAELALLRARLEVALANAVLDEAGDLFAEQLPRHGADRARAETRRAASRPPGDPVRSAIQDGLRADLGAQLGEVAAGAIDAAAPHFGRALDHYLDVLEHGVDGTAVQGIQAILLAAEEFDRAAALGHLALDRGDLTQRSRVALVTMEVLMAAGRRDEAARRVQLLIDDREHPFELAELEVEDMYHWCELLHELELWRALQSCAGPLRTINLARGEPADREGQAVFHSAVALANLDRFDRLAPLLNRIPVSDAEPFPGFRLETWSARARTAAADGFPREERRSREPAAASAGRRGLARRRAGLPRRGRVESERALPHPGAAPPARPTRGDRAGLGGGRDRGDPHARTRPGARRGGPLRPQRVRAVSRHGALRGLHARAAQPGGGARDRDRADPRAGAEQVPGPAPGARGPGADRDAAGTLRPCDRSPARAGRAGPRRPGAPGLPRAHPCGALHRRGAQALDPGRPGLGRVRGTAPRRGGRRTRRPRAGRPRGA